VRSHSTHARAPRYPPHLPAHTGRTKVAGRRARRQRRVPPRAGAPQAGHPRGLQLCGCVALQYQSRRRAAVFSSTSTPSVSSPKHPQQQPTNKPLAPPDARTKWLDQAVEAALAGGIDQVVVVAAGYDTRSYRCGW
jgi:hypothetical protein